MKYNRILRISAVLVFIIINFFPLDSNVQAGKADLTGTHIKIEMPKSISVGESMLVSAQLMTDRRTPINNQTIHFYLNGVKVRSAKTDFMGRASAIFKRDQAGTFQFNVVYSGSRRLQLGNTHISSALVVNPAIVEVDTIPALPGIKFSLGGYIYSSDATGITRIPVQKAGTYQLNVLPMTFTGPGFQANFSRWGDQTYLPSRDVIVPNKTVLQAGFNVSYQVSHNFTNLQGSAVDSSLITSMSLKGSDGTVYSFEDNQPHWLQANRVVRLGSFQVSPILYSVSKVDMRGSNVVSNAQQRFYVHLNDNWTINLLLYSANFTARDMLFNFPIKSKVLLKYPDGQIEALDFGKNAIYTAGGLPRGNYGATASGPWGVAPTQPIALSRDQNVDLQVLSYLDMGIVSILGLSLVLGLLFIGRPEILSNLIAITRRSTSGTWRENIRDWRLNWQSVSKSSSYFEVSPVNYARPGLGNEVDNRKSISGAQLAISASCPVCGSASLIKMGRGRLGRQRVHCNNCGANRTLHLDKDNPTQQVNNETLQ